MGPTGQCFPGLDEARPAGAGLNIANLWLNCPFRSFIIIVKLDLRLSSPQGQSTQLVESKGGDERDQAGAEAAFHLHPQPVVSSHTVTAASEGPLQQPAGKLQQSFYYPKLMGKNHHAFLWSMHIFDSHHSWIDLYSIINICLARFFLMFYTVHADPSVVEKHGPRQRVRNPEQTVAEQLQQGAGLRSVLNATGWWSLIFNLTAARL